MMKAFEALAILESLDPMAEVTLIIGKQTKKVSPPTPVQPITLWNSDTREWVIGKQFWPKQDVTYPNYVYCTGTMQ